MKNAQFVTALGLAATLIAVARWWDMREPMAVHYIPCIYHDVFDKTLGTHERWCLPNWTAVQHLAHVVKYRDTDAYLPIAAGQTLGDAYHVTGYLGRGSFSTVWRVRHLKKQKHYAAKVLQGHKRAVVGEFEMTLMTHAKHRNLLHLVDKFTHLNHTVLIFPLLESLNDLLNAVQPARCEALAQHVARSLLEALHYLHTEWNLVHTDVKPHNVLYHAKTRRFFLGDFGMADFAPIRKRNATEGFSLQTLGYRAPETNSSAHNNVSFPIDVWGLGCTVYEALSCGEPLFPYDFVYSLNRTSYAFEALPPLAVDFLLYTLAFEPHVRWNTTQLMGHPWLISQK